MLKNPSETATDKICFSVLPQTSVTCFVFCKALLNPCRYRTTDSSIERRNPPYIVATSWGLQPKFWRICMNSFKPALFDDHAQAIAKRQYMQPSDGDIYGMFRRVAAWVASAEKSEQDKQYWSEQFYQLMASKRFAREGECWQVREPGTVTFSTVLCKGRPSITPAALKASWKWRPSWLW
jgi:hypothetical protein